MGTFRRIPAGMALLLGLSLSTGMPVVKGQPAAADPAAAYDVNPRRLSLIPPGTIIGNEAPKGWSHLVIKSHPRVGAGDVNQLNQMAQQLSSFLFTAIVANVQGEPVQGQARHRLAGLAVGLGTAVNGQDMIVSPDTHRKLGANLGLIASIVLSTAHTRLEQVILVARSNTMGLVDAAGLMLVQGKHRPVVLRYALLVDAHTGKLETLVWLRDPQTQTIEWLPPNKNEDCILHVDGNEFVLGQPTENAFAMISLPKGQKQLAMPEEIRNIQCLPRLTAAQAHVLEFKLRELLVNRR